MTTGAQLKEAIERTTPLVDPRLSEVDWDDVAAELRACDICGSMHTAELVRGDQTIMVCAGCGSEEP